MQTYIALLRGINVSGHKKIKMADLRVYLEEIGFQDVQTYIQSGNIVFRSKKLPSDNLEILIKNKIQEKYGFGVPVIVITPDEINYAANNNPFEKNSAKDPKKFAVIFLQEQPSQENIEILKGYDYRPEEYVLTNKLIYFYAANGAGNAKMTNNFFENKLKVKATSRNWRTTHKLLEMVNSI